MSASHTLSLGLLKGVCTRRLAEWDIWERHLSLSVSLHGVAVCVFFLEAWEALWCFEWLFTAACAEPALSLWAYVTAAWGHRVARKNCQNMSLFWQIPQRERLLSDKWTFAGCFLYSLKQLQKCTVERNLFSLPQNSSLAYYSGKRGTLLHLIHALTIIST